MTQLVDQYGRIHDYLRISVTDRCNLRCVYCMPAEGMVFDPPEKIMRYEEIEEVVKVAAKLGVSKLRLTGGEPLVRKDIEILVEKLSAIPGIKDIALTTNGIFLAKKAKRLKEAGITRVNLSLDSMNPVTFSEITRGGDLSKVIAGLEACFEVGIAPVKINVVLMKGMNDGEVDDFLQLAMEKPVHIRFIEYMPIGHDDDGWKNRYFPLSNVLDHIKKLGYQPVAEGTVPGNGPADYWKHPDAKGNVGFIHPVSDHFCQTCTRLRLTADGYIKPCLFWQDELFVRRHIGNEEAIADVFKKALNIKPENHEMAQKLIGEDTTFQPTIRRMSQIGG
ncbi:GTP 3',8-cyclase MoaA [Microaerobacter geothermalis]|uniref:GTP 3',8-cyclase MoaA n=1 Tax=Microaerobacter geothermalis TaxID=674972 RepID=UPI001F1B8440|nr:GTP 3',8-cyclase MoaA [Microaerobacter geothermalis]MCF6094143.1 GTP 3',8-cyclase MoaA [Microaerobacter geothermalis]